MSRLAFEDVACLRGGRLLFEGLSFALGSGEAMLVTGPNGVGKSSLIRLAAGLLTPAAGRVDAEGRAALADENAALDRDLPLGKALGFWARLDGGDAPRGLEAVGLAHLTDAPVRILSTGQRKRATLARVIASGADIWLLDEPGNGLDAASLALIEAAIAAHRTRGGIVLAASHQPLAMDGAQVLEPTPTPSSLSEVEGPGRAKPRPSAREEEGLGSARPNPSTSLGKDGEG